MKSKKWYIILFFLLLFLFVGKDMLFACWIQKDSTLQESIILDNDYVVLKNEYEKLLVENKLWQTFSDEFITSKVVIRDPYLFFDEVTILKGKKDNIKADDVIINSKGYVGRVKSVSENYSQVELLTNKNTQLQVKVSNSYGILKKEKGILKIFEITSKEKIEEGTTVYTSGLAGIPGDIEVGKVQKVVPTALGQELEIEPSVNFQDILFVTIRKKGVSNEF